MVFDVHILWIRGHTKDLGNDTADKHAGEAADETIENDTRWRPCDWGFFEFRRDYLIHFTNGKSTAN